MINRVVRACIEEQVEGDEIVNRCFQLEIIDQSLRCLAYRWTWLIKVELIEGHFLFLYHR